LSGLEIAAQPAVGATPGASRWARWRPLRRWDEALAGTALALMLLVPLIEIAARPFLGRGVENAPVVVQHLGLVLAMFGALAAGRYGHLTTLGSSLDQVGGAGLQAAVKAWARGSSALVCGLLAVASWRFVATEIGAAQGLAYGVPVWALQAALPVGFALLGLQLGARCAEAWAVPGALGRWLGRATGLALPAAGIALGWWYDGYLLPLRWPWCWRCWPARPSSPCSAGWRWRCSGAKGCRWRRWPCRTTRSPSTLRCRRCRCSRWRA
jgi:TRAP-type C4-dicarboxylate transport system permease small subunit